MKEHAEARPSADPVISLDALTRVFGEARVVDGISLTVERGEIFGYIGPNGAGKTTTIRMLTGLLRPTSGDATLCGRSILEHPLETKALLGYVPESGAVFEKLSPREYLSIVGDLYRIPRLEQMKRIEEWLETFSLSDRADNRMDSLSKGMKQKVCIIAALLHEPEIIFLDEPLNGLDVEAVVLIKDLMRRLASEGKTFFYTSHLMDVVEKVCDRIAVINKGRLVGLGTPEDVRLLADEATLEGAVMNLWRQS